MDDRAAQGALGPVVGRLHPLDLDEGPKRRPDLQQVLGEAPGELVAPAFGAALKQRFELPLERRDLALQAAAVAVGAEVIPGREQAPGYVEPLLAELLLGGEPFGVGGQIADQVRPAGLAALRIEATVGPPAIGADDALEVLAEQGRGLALVAVGGDAKDGGLRSDGAPQGALSAAQLPAGLIDVERRCRADAGKQVLIGLCQGLTLVRILTQRRKTRQVTTRQWKTGGVASALPCGSMARTRNLWLPSFTFTLCGEVQAR